MNYRILIIAFCFFAFSRVAAQDSVSIEKINPNKTETAGTLTNKEYKPLAPAKAAFYSAVLPGLGQAYNHSYWKIPIVYAGLGTGIYFYIQNNDQFHRYREAYKRRLAGHEDDQFQGKLSDEGLVRAQKQFRKNKEISIFVTVIIYALNIVDANVEAHLSQFNVSKDLSLQPGCDFNDITGDSNYGLSLNFKF